MHFSGLLDKLFNELQISNPPLCPLLQSGIDSDYLLQAANGLHLNFPDELLTYFAWKNGVADQTVNDNPLISFEIFPFGFPLTFEYSIKAYKFYAVENSYWKKDHFPVFESNLGDYFLLDTESESDTQGMILYFSPATPYWEGAISTADSFPNLIKTVIMCYKANTYHIETNSQGQAFLENDFRSESEIWEENNPRAQLRKLLKNS